MYSYRIPIRINIDDIICTLSSAPTAWSMGGVKGCVSRVLCDSVAIAFLVIFLIIGTILEDNGIVTRRGFYCDDESIRYPYRPDTVPTWALVVGSVGIPLVAVRQDKLTDQTIV